MSGFEKSSPTKAGPAAQERERERARWSGLRAPVPFLCSRFGLCVAIEVGSAWARARTRSEAVTSCSSFLSALLDEVVNDRWTSNEIQKWLEERTKEHKAHLARRLLLLETFGDELGMPNVRALGAGLFELREMRFGYRIYFGFDDKRKRIIVALVGGDKSSQVRDIKKARELLK